MYNNTLFGSSYDRTNKASYNTSNANGNKYDPFDYFNENSMRNLGLVNRFIIRPAYETLKLHLENSITTSLDTFKLIYIIVISIFLSGVILIYLFFWRPFENRLNTTVKKF